MSEDLLSKSYDPAEVERGRYEQWEQAGWFAPGFREGAGSYCIMIPPPNVTGSLHMGHAFQVTLMDALVRFRRMEGCNTLWQTGTDHAGIATQMVVERLLEGEGNRREALGREAFVRRIWQWKESSGGTIVRQLRRMGASCDWTRERFTMDAGLSHAVREVFVRLHDEGLIYRGQRLVNWDPVLHTAVSDLEVVSEEEEGHLWYLRYPLASGEGVVVVATTRPETMLGDTAVAVHPEDARYQSWIGREVRLPLADRLIPIIADAHVDPAFGTGCVKVTPGHDFNDYEIGKRHGLPIINLFTPTARLGENAPESWRGLTREEARVRVVAEMTALQLVERILPHRLMIPRGDRSRAVVEPMLTDQWFVRVAPLAEEAIRAVEDGRIRLVPANWSKTYFEWMRNVQDWCISRQIWWGHRIPAWYGPDGQVFVNVSEEEAYESAAEHYGRQVTLRQDEDVLDTWFSSALWPFSTLGWPDRTREMAAFYPTSVLVTGFDIIFFWVARMIMMGLKFTGEVPFRTVYIHGLVRDAEGNKMSKSKGNVLDPLDLIDGIDLPALVTKRTREMMQPQWASRVAAATRKEFPDGIAAFGTDALRFTFASLATQGRDIKFDRGRLEGYRHFCNKLWNAARFVLLHLERGARMADHGVGDHARAKELPERWILSRLARVIQTVTLGLEEFRFNDVAFDLYHFVWGEYCDWYLEFSKPVLNGPEVSRAAVSRQVAASVLEVSLRLLHPLMPFITETLWERVVGEQRGRSLMVASWPRPCAEEVDEEAEREMAWVMEVIVAIRTLRAEMGIGPGVMLTLLVKGGDAGDPGGAVERMRRHQEWVMALARLASWQETVLDEVSGCATAVVAGLQLLVPLAGVIDVDAESARLGKELSGLEAELGRLHGKLGNGEFIAKASPEAVAKARAKAVDGEARRSSLMQAMARLQRLRVNPNDGSGSR